MCEKLGPLDSTKSFPVNMKQCIAFHLEFQDSLDVEAMSMFLSSQNRVQSDPWSSGTMHHRW